MDLGEGVHFRPLSGCCPRPDFAFFPCRPRPPDNCFQRKKKLRNQKKNHGPRGQKTETRSSAYTYSFFFFAGRRQ